jgi:hypothetical protein
LRPSPPPLWHMVTYREDFIKSGSLQKRAIRFLR